MPIAIVTLVWANRDTNSYLYHYSKKQYVHEHKNNGQLHGPPTYKCLSQLRRDKDLVQGRRHNFQSGGALWQLRAKRAKIFDPIMSRTLKMH